MASLQQIIDEEFGSLSPRDMSSDLNSRPALAASTSAAASRGAVSESSDDGLRMSPAAARRFARRSLRQTHATPDLVTSLVRPPSPDPFYVSRDFQGLAASGSMTGLGRHSPFAIGGRLASNDTNRRSGPLLPPHPSSLDIPKRYGGNAIFDLYSLTYVNEPDPNLLCPICHDPLVDPVTTPCDHTFCYRCLRRSIASSPSGTACPIDRERLAWTDCFSAARLIRTQLNSLVVKCPYNGRGCDMDMRREVAEPHAKNECIFREYTCPGTDCDKRIRYKPTDDKCRHQQDSCTYCHAAIEDAEREFHLLSCPSSKTRCESCWQLICRDQMSIHHEVDCDGVEVGCPYKDVGCPVRIMRGNLDLHTLACAFHPDTPSGAIIRTQRELIQSYGDLGSQLRDVHTRQDEANRRLDEIVTAMSRRGGGDAVTLRDNRTIQDLDAGFEEVHQNLTQLEARQSMWTLNQVMPIREEVAELRTNINMIRMHVNWLMNRSREEGRVRAANNTGAPSATIRPESSGGTTTVLPERRRSSSTDFDLPRL
ncbi:TNF receptor-associated factor 6-like protein [Cladobotryum mycophilum]|uniref:TNF receptor-associated factor 6-like protein n=1 Tax=Cladobotryum mycophilum TaxID=491253 RepID=A0ABR0T197_9HYPO